jgi:nucleoid-associated protein YgaU
LGFDTASGGDPNVRLNPPVQSQPPSSQVAQATRPGSDGNSFGSPTRPLPPVGATTSVTSPPIAVPVPPSAAAGQSTSHFVPQVESYDEETYLCRAGDTLEAVCQRYYHADKYARALLLFNRNHPRSAAGLWKDPPELVDGQPVYIPPLRVLEKYYAAAIPDHRPLTLAVPPAAEAPAGTVAASSTGGVRYVVRQSEMISAIARTTLGSLERWNDLYELNNRSFDPSRPVPAGTVLVMPADARVPDANRP